jgi:hypothetical protein
MLKYYSLQVNVQTDITKLADCLKLMNLYIIYIVSTFPEMIYFLKERNENYTCCDLNMIENS